MYEDSGWDECPLGAQLGEYVGCHVIVPEDVVEFQAIEMGLELVYLLAVGIHLFLRAFPVLVDLLNDYFRVAVGEEPLDAEGGSNPETVDKGLVLDCVVGSLKE